MSLWTMTLLTMKIPVYKHLKRKNKSDSNTPT